MPTTTSDGKCNTGPTGLCLTKWTPSVVHSICRLVHCKCAVGVSPANALGPRQCMAVGVCPAKALWWGLGSVQRVFAPPRWGGIGSEA